MDKDEANEMYLLAKAVHEHHVNCNTTLDSCRFCYGTEGYGYNGPDGVIGHEKGCPVLIARKYVAN